MAKNSDKCKYPNCLRALRKRAGMVQSDVAEALGLTQGGYSMLETGIINLAEREEYIRKLCSLFKCKRSALFQDQELITCNREILFAVDGDIENLEGLIQSCKNSNQFWIQALCDDWGPRAAIYYAVGASTLHSFFEICLDDLRGMPAGSHIGMIAPEISQYFPQRFLPRYGYEFIYELKLALYAMTSRMAESKEFAFTSVREELLLKLIGDFAKDVASDTAIDEFFDEIPHSNDDDDDILDVDPEAWVEMVFEVGDIYIFLYDKQMPLSPLSLYHFDRWGYDYATGLPEGYKDETHDFIETDQVTIPESVRVLDQSAFEGVECLQLDK